MKLSVLLFSKLNECWKKNKNPFKTHTMKRSKTQIRNFLSFQRGLRLGLKKLKGGVRK